MNSQVFSVLLNANIFDFAGNFFLIIVLLARVYAYDSLLVHHAY